jgi:hypothetical protein
MSVRVWYRVPQRGDIRLNNRLYNGERWVMVGEIGITSIIQKVDLIKKLRRKLS